MNKKITMVELAKIAGVDISTVSRALNDSPVVKQATKEHVKSVAEKYGYEVNVAASNLRRQSSGSLGIVIPIAPQTGQTMSDPFFLEMVGSVSQTAADKGFDLVVSIPREPNKVSEERLLRARRADGLIIIGQADRQERLTQLSKTQSNFIVWGARIERSGYTTVGSDNIYGGKLAAEHLLQRGCRNFTFLGDPSLPEVDFRLRGFSQTLAENGIGFRPDQLISENFAGKSAFDKVSKFIQSQKKVDAIFAASDLLAISAIHAVISNGLSVPKDVKIIGYDNIGQSSMTSPPLTTISQNISDGGALMVDLLIRKINGESVRSRYTETELIRRQST